MDPKLRKTVLKPGYFPNSASMDEAETVILRAGERREGVDIRMLRSPNYCVEATLLAAGAPAALAFEFSELWPSNGGGAFRTPPKGKSGPDGRIRICDLAAGEYRLTATDRIPGPDGGASVFGTAIVGIIDQDVRNVRISAEPGRELSGEVAWDGSPPAKPIDARITIQIRRLSAMGQVRTQSSIPGEFSFPDVWVDEYAVTVSALPRGVYVKDITYGSSSVLHDPLRFGSAIGNAGLRVVLAWNGGFVSMRVADEDGNPAPQTYVYVMPKEVVSEPALSAVYVIGQTDQNGLYSSDTLRPGKYYVLAATGARIDRTPERIHALWGARSRAKEVDILPSAALEVTLEPAAIE
jgi:hypothetical protein